MASKDYNRSPIMWYGGKANMVETILPMFPDHSIYVEPFAGGASLLFAKQPAENEAINDANGHIVNFYRVYKTQYENLKQLVDATPHSKAEHTRAGEVLKSIDDYSDLDRAWAYWVKCCMSFLTKPTGGWSYHINGKSFAGGTFKPRKDMFTQSIGRLDNVQIEHGDALDCIKKYDTISTFFYVDPPYYNSDCGHYIKSGNRELYVSVVELLKTVRAKFAFSSYPTPELEQATKEMGWNYFEFEMSRNARPISTEGGHRKIEVVVTNYEPPGQFDLFSNQEEK